MWVGTKNASAYGRDWAVVELSAPLGRTYGWLGVRAEDVGVVVSRAGQYGTIGYDKDGYVDMGGKVVGCSLSRHEDHYSHDCDTWFGASGAPIFRVSDMTVVALHVAHDPHESVIKANYASPAREWVGVLYNLTRQAGKTTSLLRVACGGESCQLWRQGKK